jgi:heme-degrading monooxygenase HmoA
MFARVSRMQGTAKELPAGIEYFAQMTNVVKKMQGWQGGYVFASSDTGKIMVIIFWETEADLQASAEAATELRRQAGLMAGAVGAPLVENYEVVLQA